MPRAPSSRTLRLSRFLVLSDSDTLSDTVPRPVRRFRLDRALAGLADCGRVLRDIVIGMLCGVTAGLFYAMVDASFLT
jgi:hypothetical protein